MESSSSRLMWFLGLVVLQVLAAQFQISLCTGCLELERNALLQIKTSMFPYSSTFFGSWDSGYGKGVDGCCGWRGVECDIKTGKVIKLALSRASYEWPLNTSLFLPFEDLTHLDLTDNGISSLVPNQGLGPLHGLDKLEVLKLGLNNLNNSILPSLGLPSTLKALSLDGNKFTGSFDVRELSYTSNLEELDLSSNGMTDVKGLESLSKLTVLNLRENKLSDGSTILQSNGSFGCNNLRELDLRFNNLHGMIPSWLGNCTSLQFLDLSQNHFQGNLALSPVSYLSNLEYLIVSDNILEIPVSLTSFYNHSKLKVLAADNNRLLSDDVEFHLPRLVPKFQLQLLSFLNCWSNHLITRLPDFLYYQSDLRILDLSQINLGVPFPTWLVENNTLLEQCYMRNNSLSGSFLFLSHQLFPKTTVIDISNNHLVGKVLENVGRIFPGLEMLDMSGNLFGGRVPTSTGKLEMLDLSHNNLVGEIPKTMVIDWPSLSFLGLSHNSLSGQLFPAVGF